MAMATIIPTSTIVVDMRNTYISNLDNLVPKGIVALGNMA